MINALKKAKRLSVGFSSVQSCIMDKRADEQSEVLVFIVNNSETEAINKQLISTCRQLNLPHFILPKFLLSGLTQLFRVKRLTCFAIRDEFTSDKVKVEFHKRLSEFDNRQQTERIDKLKYAQETMFKPVHIKRWEVIKNVVPKKVCKADV